MNTYTRNNHACVHVAQAYIAHICMPCMWIVKTCCFNPRPKLLDEYACITTVLQWRRYPIWNLGCSSHISDELSVISDQRTYHICFIWPRSLSNDERKAMANKLLASPLSRNLAAGEYSFYYNCLFTLTCMNMDWFLKQPLFHSETNTLHLHTRFLNTTDKQTLSLVSHNPHN